MHDWCEPVPEAEDAGDRDAAVITAIGRIGSSLNLDTALREGVDGTRAGRRRSPGASPSRWRRGRAGKVRPGPDRLRSATLVCATSSAGENGLTM